MRRASASRPRRPATPVEQLLLLARTLVRPGASEARAAAARIDAILASAPARLIPALDRAFRDGRVHAALGIDFLDLEPEDVARLDPLDAAGSGALGLVSLVRSGRAREAAVGRLAAHVDRVATAFLVNRLNDYVDAVAARAWSVLETRLTPAHAAALVACLPLIDRMATWIRAGAERRERILAALRAPGSRPALWAGARDRDPEVVRAACALLAALHRGQPEMQEILAAALTAHDPRTRRWAARVAGDPGWTPRATLDALGPRLSADSAPAIRLVGLAARVARGDREGIARAAFDVNAEVRHHARLALADAPLDYRGEALAALTAPGRREAVLAALATLSDFGRAEDLALVARFEGDPRPSIAREARRTLALLRAL